MTETSLLAATGEAPLQGLRVLDAGQYIAAPAAAQTLADLGADVIKLEPPGGDAARHVGTLAQLPELATAHAVRAPALLVVGEVAALATRLHWFGAPPLAGEHPRCPPDALARAA